MFRALAALGFLATLWGCNSLFPRHDGERSQDPDDARRAEPRLPATWMPVPIRPQEVDYSCGAAVMHALLNYWQVFSGTEADLREELGTTEQDGTQTEPMIAAAQKRGLMTDVKIDVPWEDLSRFVASAWPVILNLQAWPDRGIPNDWRTLEDDGHYIILTGVDDGYVYAMDPSLDDGYGYIPKQEFLSRWHDGGDEHTVVFVIGSEPLTPDEAEVNSESLRLHPIQ